MPPPPTPVSVAAGAGGARAVRFANPHDGWLFGPDLWATHDGGAHWRRVNVPGLAAPVQVEALETANGRVHAAVIADGGDVRLASSPVDRDGWRVTQLAIPLGAGPVPSAQIVLHGSAGWMVQVDRTVIGGARLQGGVWREWTPPCTDTYGSGVLAASSAVDLVAACEEGIWGPAPRARRLYVSADGGVRFHRASTAVPVPVGAIASPAPGVAVVGGPGASGASLVATADGGAQWKTVYDDPHSGAWLELGFTTPQQGVAVAGVYEGVSTLVITRDGGRTWTPVRFS